MFNHIQTRSSNLPKLAQSQETASAVEVRQRPIVFPSKKKKKQQKTPADLAVEEQKDDPEDAFGLFPSNTHDQHTNTDSPLEDYAADNGSIQGVLAAMFGNCASIIEMACGGTCQPSSSAAAAKKKHPHPPQHHSASHIHPSRLQPQHHHLPYQPPLQAPPMQYADPYASELPPPILLNDPNHPPVNHMQPFNPHPQQPHYATQHYHVAPEPPPLSIADELRALAARTGIPLMPPPSRPNRDIPQFLGEDQLYDDDNISAISAHTLEEMVARSQGKLKLHPLSKAAQQQKQRAAMQAQHKTAQSHPATRQPPSQREPPASSIPIDPPTKTVEPESSTTLSVQSSLNDDDFYDDLSEDDDDEPPSPTRTGSSSSGGRM